VDTLLKFRLLALNSTEPGAVFQASLACGRLLLRVQGGVVMEMLQFNKTLMALATLMYAPVPIEEALSVSSSNQPWHVEPSSLKSAVAAYPTLQAALFPPPPTSLTAAQSQDISLYQLLQGTVLFDVSRLFKWQPTNTLATVEDTADGPPVIPHFSQPQLADRYARVERLTYLHYLSRGQPSFAFANFMAAKLLGRSNTTKRIDRAVCRVYRLAMQDFANHRLVSSCAAFLEMVDRESRLLRVDIQAAVRMARYSSLSPPEAEKLYHRSRALEETQGNAKIASQFIQLYGSTEEQGVASGLLQQLETATHSLISSSSIDRCCLEAEEQWSLVQAFCSCHSLPPSAAFLTVCAEDGQWLPLLCHAQLHQVPPQKVLPIIEKSFSNPHIQEHLRLALSSMDPTGPATLASSQRGGKGFPERPKSRRRRANTRARLTQGLQQQTLLRTKPDIRAKLYSKIGLQRERSLQPDSAKQDKTPTEQPLTSSRTVAGHPGEGETPPALSPDNLPDDLFAILFKCQSHSCPWRALLAHAVALQRPLLAILAACNQEAVMVDCLCVWLYCTLGVEQLSKATVLLGLMGEHEEKEGKAYLSPAVQWHHWSPQDLALMLAVSLQLPVSHTAPHFTLAFLYFDQNNPLLSFFKFHEQFTLYCNLDRCKNHLLEFDLAMSKCSSAVGGYLGLIGDVCWVERLANMVTSHMLVICPTPFEREHLLRLLHDGTFGQGFQSSGLDFKNLYQMTEVLSQAGLPTDAAFTIREHFNFTPGAKSIAEVYSVRVRVDSDRVLSMLLDKAQFDVARSYATIVGSTANEVTVKEAEHNLRKLSESSYWQYEQARLNFWHSCNTSFNKEKVDPELAAEFFESVVHHSSDVAKPTPSSPTSSPSSSSSSSSSHSFPPLTCSATERALLLAFALKWRRETDTMTADQLKEFEREIWRSHIRASVEDMQRAPGDRSGGSPLPFLPSYSPEDILSSEEPSSLLSALSITVTPSYSGQRNLAELALPDNVPVLTEASQHRDTASSLTDPQEVKAFNMMLGRLLNAGFISQARELAALFEHDSPDLTIVLCCIQLAQGKLSTEQLTDEVLSLVSTHSPRHLSELTLGVEQRGDSRPSAEIVRMMQRLSDRAKHAQHCCSCITTCFKVAVCLHMSYTSVVTSDPFKILSQVLSCRFTDRYQLAKKFVSDSNLKSKEVAGFLSECVASALQSQSGMSMREREGPHSRVYYPQMTSAQFAELAQLCPDHNEVGSHLLSMAKSLSTTQQQTTQNITVQVELLVRAHDCYTLGCSVDGISEVLLVVRQWVPNLILLKLFSLVVRLLTGIGRFYEMDYILQLLMENDQFESLLHTGLEKEEQLRVALMDYLQTHHPNDHEKMQMVALKFGMFYELANTKQEQAKRDLRRIKPKHLASSNPETVKTLKAVFESLRTAAKTYSQEDYLSSAQQCYSLARLVALQLSLLHGSGNKQVINLDHKKVVKLMEELPFQEALIVADAYKRTSWTDWVGPLYKKVVIGGHFHYLSDYKTAFPLKANMFQELASRYQHDRERPPESAANMRRILGHLRNLPLKRKIATDLGLSDVLQSLSPTQDEGFLNDIARL
jgi:spatacsin